MQRVVIRPLFLVLIVYVLLAIPQPGAGNTIEVCSVCTQTSISNALLSASAGDVIVVQGGNYSEPTITTEVSLHLVANGTVQVQLNETSSVLWLILSDDISFNGTWIVIAAIQLNSPTMMRQYGFLSLTTEYAYSDLELQPGTTWNQYGDAEIYMTGQSGVYFNGGGVWNQYGTISLINTNAYNGVSFIGGGTWNQWGPGILTNTGPYSGVSFNRGGIWNQYASFNITFDATPTQIGGAGVYILYGGAWYQNATTIVTINGPTYGIQLINDGGYWVQDAPVTVVFNDGYPTAIGIDSDCNWQQNAAVSISRIFVNQGNWSQNGNVTINSQASNSCGINITTGTGSTWTRFRTSSLSFALTGSQSEGICNGQAPSPVLGTPSPSPFPSLPGTSSPLPSVLPIRTTINSSFSHSSPSVNITTSTGSSSPGLQVNFGQIQAGNSSTNMSNVMYTGWSVLKANESGNTTTTYIYYSTLLTTDSNRTTSTAGTLSQSFSFSSAQRSTAINSSNQQSASILIPADNLKWTVTINSSSPVFSKGVSITYSLTDLAALLGTYVGTASNTTIISRKSSTPNIIMTTTYYLPLTTIQESTTQKLVGVLEALDQALVDGSIVMINHSVTLSTLSDGAGGSYVLTLNFPAFNQSLFYDPTLGLGLLLGQSSSEGGNSNQGLITGTIVGIIVAITLVGLIITTTTVVGIILAKQKKNERHSANFDGTENHNKEEEQHSNTVRRRLTLLFTTVYQNKLYLSNFFQNETYDPHSQL